MNLLKNKTFPADFLMQEKPAFLNWKPLKQDLQKGKTGDKSAF
jgi:hypothetical protein